MWAALAEKPAWLSFFLITSDVFEFFYWAYSWVHVYTLAEDEHVVWLWLGKGKPHECPVCFQYLVVRKIWDMHIFYSGERSTEWGCYRSFEILHRNPMKFVEGFFFYSLLFKAHVFLFIIVDPAFNPSYAWFLFSVHYWMLVFVQLEVIGEGGPPEGHGVDDHGFD